MRVTLCPDECARTSRALAATTEPSMRANHPIGTLHSLEEVESATYLHKTNKGGVVDSRGT
jgi:hypothetical protein